MPRLPPSVLEFAFWVEEKDDVETFDRIKAWIRNIDMIHSQTVLSVSKYVNPDGMFCYYVMYRRML